MMEWDTMDLVIKAARSAKVGLIDITGGAPELNPLLRRFITVLAKDNHRIQVRTNLTVLLEEKESIIDFYRKFRIKLLASLPCYLKKEVDSQRGDGVFDRSIEALARLNKVGYGIDPQLGLDLVFNPEDAFLPPDQSSLEKEYRLELYEKFGISFNKILTITNMPVGRFIDLLRKENRANEYELLLRNSFNPKTLEKLMCRHQVNIGWDGMLYDCDFNLALNLPMNASLPHIGKFDSHKHSIRKIVTGEHCFGCTAGTGSSCEGSLES
jgi:radical SAM/Cys-rich protein